MYNIFNNNSLYQLFRQIGGKSNLDKNSYLTGFTYFALLVLYSFEMAGYCNDDEGLKNLQQNQGFFVSLIIFSFMVPLFVIVVIFLSRAEAESANIIKYIVMILIVGHMSITLAALGLCIGKSKSESETGFTFARVVIVFITMMITVWSGMLHKRKKHGYAVMRTTSDGSE